MADGAPIAGRVRALLRRDRGACAVARRRPRRLPDVPAALPADRGAGRLSSAVRDLSQHAEQEDDVIRRPSNFAFLLKRTTFQLVIFQSCFFAVSAVILKAMIGFILAHLLHAISAEPAHPARHAADALGDPAGAVHAGLVVAVRPVLFRVQLGAERVWLRLRPLARRSLDARLCVILVNVWYGTPFFMIMYLAALKSVPEQLYEAATIDGANAMQKLLFVTLPMMRNIILSPCCSA